MVAAFNYSSAIVAPADTGRIHRRAVRPMPPAPLADAAASSSWLAAVGGEQLGAHDYRPRWRKWVGLLRARSSSAAFQNRTHSACSPTSGPVPRCGSSGPRTAHTSLAAWQTLPPRYLTSPQHPPHPLHQWYCWVFSVAGGATHPPHDPPHFEADLLGLLCLFRLLRTWRVRGAAGIAGIGRTDLRVHIPLAYRPLSSLS